MSEFFKFYKPKNCDNFHDFLEIINLNEVIILEAKLISFVLNSQSRVEIFENFS